MCLAPGAALGSPVCAETFAFTTLSYAARGKARKMEAIVTMTPREPTKVRYGFGTHSGLPVAKMERVAFLRVSSWEM